MDYAEGVVTQEQLHAATRRLRTRIAEPVRVLAATTRSRALAVVDGVPDLQEARTGSTRTPAAPWSGQHHLGLLPG